MFFIKINVSHFSYFHAFFNPLLAVLGQAIVVLLESGSINLHRLLSVLKRFYLASATQELLGAVGLSTGLLKGNPFT